MFAGKTLAEIALAIESDPSLVPAAQAELSARIARPNARPGSVKRAQAALARMAQGESPAIPARPEKAPAPAGAKTTPAKGGNPNRAQVRTNALGRPVVSPEQAFKLVMDLGRASGHSIPRWISAGAKGRMPAAK